MQGIVDLVGAVSNLFTRTIWILILGGIIVVGIVTMMIGYTAPAVVAEVGERAERISNKAIETAREESRAHALAAEGWGYADAAHASSDSGADTSSDMGADESFDDGSNSYGDDWGSGAE